jgi:Cu-Zn family superoxide dismutase
MVLGRAVVVHEKPDDLKTQPSGNSGGRIACGVIGAAKDAGTGG